MYYKALFLFALLVGGSIGHAAEYKCNDPLFTVHADDPDLVKRACSVATRARALFASCETDLSKPVDIQFNDKVESDFGLCHGAYHCDSRVIEIQTLKAFAADRTGDDAFSHLPDDVYWDSILTHELAHAAYNGVTCPYDGCPITAEFMAYVFQIQSLPDDHLAQFEKNLISDGMEGRYSISLALLAIAPDKFAQTAWSYFKNHPEPCALMGQVMTGQVVFDVDEH